MSGKVVCIVDDDEVFQFMTKIAIENALSSAMILTFNDGVEAISYLRENKEIESALPEVLFLDINMPFMDGWGFIEEYKKIKDECAKPITIYMTTSSLAHDDVSKAKSYLEIQGYVVKPIEPDLFHELLSKVQSSDNWLWN